MIWNSPSSSDSPPLSSSCQPILGVICQAQAVLYVGAPGTAGRSGPPGSAHLFPACLAESHSLLHTGPSLLLTRVPSLLPAAWQIRGRSFGNKAANPVRVTKLELKDTEGPDGSFGCAIFKAYSDLL